MSADQPIHSMVSRDEGGHLFNVEVSLEIQWWDAGLHWPGR